MSENANPVFQIQRIYLKDASMEQPNSPAILTSGETPAQPGVSRRGMNP